MYSKEICLSILLMISVHYMASGQKTTGGQKVDEKKLATIFSQRVDTLKYSHLKFDTIYKFYKSKDIDIVKADNPDLYFEIFEWLNSPYSWGGRSKKGTDCAGFVNSLLNKLYARKFGGSAYALYDKCDTVSSGDIHEGDLLFFNISGRHLAHVAIYLQNGKFAHAASHGGVIVSSLEEKYYKRWFYRAGRINFVKNP